MILLRLCQNWKSMLAGSCINDAQYSKVYYADKILYDPVTEDDKLIEVENERYCNENNVEKLLFYSQKEADNFSNELRNRDIS